MSSSDSNIPFGFGPFDENGVPVCPPNPAGRGYGGTTDPDAGALYGFNPYGSGQHPRPPFPPYEGYGALSYGTSPYGAGDGEGPWIISATPTDGQHLLVTFSELVTSDSVFNLGNWAITPVYGCTPTVEQVVATSANDLTNPNPEGFIQVLVRHSGTTLGGRYIVKVAPLEDIRGNAAVDGMNSEGFLSLGTPNAIETVVADPSGAYIAAKFSRPLGAGAEDVSSYEVSCTYPVIPSLNSAQLDAADSSRVKLGILGMTSVDYSLLAGPSTAFSYDPSGGLPSSGALKLGTGDAYVIEANPTAATPAALILTKEAGSPYGWHFPDSTGTRMVAGCTFRADVSFDASGASFVPSVQSGAVAVHVCDGEYQASLVLEGGPASKKITLNSGSLSISVAAVWDIGPVNLTILRNAASGHWAVLMNGTPLICVPLTGAGSPDAAPVMAPGIQLVLAADYIVRNLPIYGVSLTASSTIYGEDLNFVHEMTSPFVGSAGMALDYLWTQRGPITKGWGDGRPGDPEDVSVSVNGVEVAVGSVNPFLGRVSTEIPIPRMPAGSIDVQVDYSWIASPRMSMGGLNTPGSILNKWDHSSGSRTASSDDSWEGGGPDEGTRFPMALALVRPVRSAPVLTSHRYIGFERGYTASLNDATSLTLNSNPHLRGPVNKFKYTPPEHGFWEGGSTTGWDGGVNLPPSATEGWASLQSDSDSILSSAVQIGTVPGSMVAVARVSVQQTAPKEGFWIGPGIGFHDVLTVKVAACVSLNGLRHLGILSGSDHTDPDSWVMGPRASCSFRASSIEVPAGSLPSFFSQGLVQILKGVQTGVYNVLSVDELSDGSHILNLAEDLPVDPELWGADTGDVIFDFNWGQPFSWILSGGSNGGVSVTYSGAQVGVLEHSGAVPPASSLPPGTLDVQSSGQVFWGHPFGSCASEWDFFRYTYTPDSSTAHSAGHLVTAEMSDIPEDQGEWVRGGHFGTSEIVGDGTVRMRSEAGTLGESTSGYYRIDTLIPEGASVDFEADFSVADGFSGWGDAGFSMEGPLREVRVSTLSFAEWPDGSLRLLSMPSSTLAGDADPSSRGWAVSGLVSATAEGQQLRLKASGEGSLLSSLELEHPYLDGVSRVLETRMAVVSHNASADGHIGLAIGMDASSPSRSIGICFLKGPDRIFLTSQGGEIASFLYPWDDGSEHVYRLEVDHTLADPAVILKVDGVILGSASPSSFLDSGSQDSVFISTYGKGLEVELSTLSARVSPPPQIRRTLGIWNGGDPALLDSWEIPKSDGAVVLMDWSDSVALRVLVDPEWGASLYRPDLPVPEGALASLRATQRTNPSEAWASLEWADLPPSRSTAPKISFGGLSSSAVSTTLWDRFRYRVHTTEDEGHLPLQGAVLNRSNVITSGELGSDLTVEERILQTKGNRANFRDVHVNAARVFSVWYDGAALPSSSWSFDSGTQEITVSQEDAAILVKFSPGTPVTTTYLAAQPVRDGVTNLNEGTPPIPLHQVDGPVTTYFHGSRLNEWSDTLNGDEDFVLNDPSGHVGHANNPDALYASMSFMEVRDSGETGLLSTPDDGPAPGQGVAGVEISGRSISENNAPLPRPVHDQRGGAMGGLLHAAGGAFSHETGRLGGGAPPKEGALLWPSAPSRPSAPAPGSAAARTLWDIRPSHQIGGPAASESSCTFTMEYLGGEEGYSRIGPWGGLDALEEKSLLSGGVGLQVSGIVLQGGAPLSPPLRVFGTLFP
jgi:hypothetical protein